MVDKTLNVQLLFTSLLPNPNIYLERVNITDNTSLLAGTLKQNLLSLKHDFNSIDRMIGISFISVQLLLTTFMNDESFADVLKSNVLFDRIAVHLSHKDLLKTRLVSTETKDMIDKKMIELKKPLIIHQSKLPEDFEYTQDSLKTLCARYSRKPKDCSLHIVYDIDPKGIRAQPLFDRTVLAQSDIKLSITITCGNNSANYERGIFRLLCSIAEDLRNTIYSLEIDLRELYLVKKSYVQFAEVLKKIPNLTILKLSDGYIQWKPFLSCIKNIKTLEELDLSDVRMLTDLQYDDSDSDQEQEEEVFVEDFRQRWYDSLKHLKGLRIAGHKCTLSYNEKADDDNNQLNLVETVLPCLEHFTQLRSFGYNADPDNGSHMELFIPYLPYLTNITRLDLSGSNLGNFREPESVAEILRYLPNLTELNLSRCYMEMRFFEIILPAIENLRNLRSLDVSNNEDFYPADIRRIKTLFKKLVFLDTHIDGTEEDLDSLE
jgi:Leucine-rich repeat (LRR) protein